MRDPMEGTPDDVPRYQCAIHGYQADDYPCDACSEADQIQQAVAVELGPARATDELLRALQRSLSRLQARKDEAMGTALQARMGGQR